MTEVQLKPCNSNKSLKNTENSNKKVSSGSHHHNSAPRKQSRKSENPTRFVPPKDNSSDAAGGFSTTWICKNSACKAQVPMEFSFCKRCSCCICHRFDDNKDPSLWLVCEPESGKNGGDYCGQSCHVECAFHNNKVGVVNPGQYMNLDGSFCCASCGKVQGILGFWKKQLAMAKDARRVDVLCDRIFLSYRLLQGTVKFEELHAIVSEAKTKLEAEVGPMNGESVKMVRGIVSRLSVAGDVQMLCSRAIDRADDWLAGRSNGAVNSLPAACQFLFEEVTSSTVKIVLVDIPTPQTHLIRGYKLWFCETRTGSFTKEPLKIFPRDMRRLLVCSLQPCTEYAFRIVSYTDAGDLGHSEAKCFTKSVEIFNRDKKACKEKACVEEEPDLNPDGFKIRVCGKFLHLNWSPEQGILEEICSAAHKEDEEDATTEHEKPPKPAATGPVGLDLNVATVPDLNEDLTPPIDSSRDEDNGYSPEQANGGGPEDDVVAEKAAGMVGSNHGSGLNGGDGGGPAVDSTPAPAATGAHRRKRGDEEAHSDSALIHDNGSPLFGTAGPGVGVPVVPGPLDGNFEYCVKVIRLLECQGYITQEFRLKLLTWFSLRSTEQERRVVNTFIGMLSDDYKSLAGQLVDTFSEIIAAKKPRSRFTCPP